MKSGALPTLVLLAVALGCSRAAHPSDSGASQPRTHGQQSDTVSVTTPAVPAPSASEPSVSEMSEAQPEQALVETPSQPVGLAERYTLKGEAPQGMAWMTIRNTYVVNQYVFLDSELMGWVPPDTEGRFEVPPGAHNVTLSDSEDGGGNAQVLAEVFDDGYSYYYDVVVR